MLYTKHIKTYKFNASGRFKKAHHVITVSATVYYIYVHTFNQILYNSAWLIPQYMHVHGDLIFWCVF
jgi:hypothetical protein